MNARDEFRRRKENRKRPLDLIVEIVHQETYEADNNEEEKPEIPTAITAGYISRILYEDSGVVLGSQTVGSMLRSIMHSKGDDPFRGGPYEGLYLTSRLGWNGGWLMTDDNENLRHRGGQEKSYVSSRKGQHQNFVHQHLPETVKQPISENVY